MPVAQDNGFDHEKGGAKLPGIMEETVTGEPGIKENRVLLFPGKDTDETGETVLGKEHAARIKRSPVIHGTHLWYQVVGVIVDQNGYFYPVDRFYWVFRHDCICSPDDAGIFLINVHQGNFLPSGYHSVATLLFLKKWQRLNSLHD
jgi:hypothetical protein